MKQPRERQNGALLCLVHWALGFCPPSEPSAFILQWEAESWGVPQGPVLLILHHGEQKMNVQKTDVLVWSQRGSVCPAWSVRLSTTPEGQPSSCAGEVQYSKSTFLHFKCKQQLLLFFNLLNLAPSPAVFTVSPLLTRCGSPTV